GDHLVGVARAVVVQLDQIGRRAQRHLGGDGADAVTEEAMADRAVDLELAPALVHQLARDRDGKGVHHGAGAILAERELGAHRQALARDGAAGRLAHGAAVVELGILGEGLELRLPLHRIEDGRIPTRRNKYEGQCYQRTAETRRTRRVLICVGCAPAPIGAKAINPRQKTPRPPRLRGALEEAEPHTDSRTVWTRTAPALRNFSSRPAMAASSSVSALIQKRSSEAVRNCSDSKTG